MRGKAGKRILQLKVAGITPAYAGKRYAFRLSFFVKRDHPRLCGEKDYAQNCRYCVKGSPPPMRGKAIALSKSPAKRRITPAYAGKSDAKKVF